MNKEDQLIEISYAEFEIEVEFPMFMESATADVWYDLTGTFFIYDLKKEKFITTLYIKDNSLKYEQIACFIFDYLMQAENFLVLTPYCEYSNLYSIIGNQIELVKKASKSYGMTSEDEYFSSMMIKETPKVLTHYDISDEQLKIVNSHFEVPSYLRDFKGGWAFDELYIYDKIKKQFTYKFLEYCPYTTDNNEITNKRQDYISSFVTDKNISVFQRFSKYKALYTFSKDQLNKLI